MRPAELLQNGFAIFPCKKKIPLTTNGVKDASKSVSQVYHWISKYPLANWAVACGEVSGIVVIDIDVGEVPLLHTLRKLFELGIPDNNVVSTPSGGVHLYCKFRSGLKNKVRLLGMPVDIRTDGGYVINHGDGYRATSWDGNLADAPEWVVEACKPKPLPKISQRASNGTNPCVMARKMLEAKEGERNHKLYSLAMWCIEEGGDLNALAQAAAEMGLPNWEIRRTIDSARRNANALDK